VDLQNARAYSDWLREQYEGLEIVIDPRYGELDVTTGQVVPLGTAPDVTDAPIGATGASPSA
ncbi:MAG: hypothetical protein ACXWXQ_08015, partial [Actinomycetota bacterium]